MVKQLLGVKSFTDINDFRFTNQDQFSSLVSLEDNNILSPNFLADNFPEEQDYKVLSELDKVYYADYSEQSNEYASVRTCEQGYVIQIKGISYKLILYWEEYFDAKENKYIFDFDPRKQYFFFRPVDLENNKLYDRKIYAITDMKIISVPSETYFRKKYIYNYYKSAVGEAD